MSEPTKGQIEEAYKLAKEFVATHAREVSPLMLFPDEIANLIAHVRKQARDDALERAKAALEGERVGVSVPDDEDIAPEDEAYNRALDHGIKAIDALKDQPTGEPQ